MKNRKPKDKSLSEPPVSKYAAKRARDHRQTAEPVQTSSAQDNWRGVTRYARERVAFNETASANGRQPGHVWPKN